MTVAVLNQEELVEPLADKLLARYFKKHMPIEWNTIDAYLAQCRQHHTQTGLLNIDFGLVNQSLHKDLRIWKDLVMAEYKAKYRELVRWLTENLDEHKLDREYLINLCINDPRPSFVKTLTGLVTKNQPNWTLRGEINATDDVVVLRNTIGNENILRYKLARQGPMWFIDSGYTNFLTGKKHWHRLVKNHIHHNVAKLKFPADRLSMFGQFPEPWAPSGEKILIVESSEEYYNMIGTTLADWRNTVTTQLRRHTDRPLEFKSKSESRKTRVSVYEQLRQRRNDYYCVVHESSAAAIEAIWLGIPVITLGPHISAPVARTSLADVNNLYRGPLGDWLCAVSYCQFSQKEILDGTAVKFIRKFHNV